MPTRRPAAVLMALLVILLVSGCGGAPATPIPAATAAPLTAAASGVRLGGPGLARLEPADGRLLGVNLNWGEDSAAAFVERLGRPVAVYAQFVHFPLRDADRTNLDGFIEQVAAQQGLALITLEPHDGLAAVTPSAANELTDLLAGYAARGVPAYIRFGHEMNGSWYAWGQQPAAYRAAFRLVAESVHQRVPGAAMLWAPNHGAGYPFTGGRFVARPGTADYAALDTTGDGALDEADDMYAPYYPGDDAVDWVGMSAYHWGVAYPWGENETPTAGKFAALITGRPVDAQRQTLPDFYAVYSGEHGKPMAITETAALYNPAGGGASEHAIKEAWVRQVFSPATARDFPRIKMINWFEWRKFEPEINGVIDWTITHESQVAAVFRQELADGHWLSGQDLARG